MLGDVAAVMLDEALAVLFVAAVAVAIRVFIGGRR